MRKTVVPTLCAVALIMVSAAACGSSSGTGSPGGPQQIRVVLPHGTIFTVGLPYAVAEAKGFFKADGVEPVSTDSAGGGTTVRTVIAGSADIGVETGPAAIMSATANNAPLKIVASSTKGDDILLFVKGSSPIKSVEGLSGQKIGFSERGSSSDLNVEAINQLLTAKNLPPAVGVPVGSPPDSLTAVETDQVAAGWTIPPTFLDKVASGDLRIAVNGFKDVPALKEDASRVTFASTSYLEQHGDAVRGFLKAWQEAWTWSFANQDEAIKIWQQKYNLTAPTKDLKLAFDYYTPQMQKALPIQGLDKVAARALAVKLVPSPITSEQLKKLVDTSYAPKD